VAGDKRPSQARTNVERTTPSSKMKKKIWNESSVRALVKNVTSGTTDNVELAQMMGVTTHQIYNKRKSLGLTKDNKPLHDPVEAPRAKQAWTMEEDQIVMMMSEEHKTDKEIAEYIGRSVVSIENRRNKLHREGLMSNLTLVDKTKRNETLIKQDEPIQSRTIQTPRTEVSLLWGLVKYTKR
jgi:transposase